MAGLQKAFKEIIDREHRFYANPPDVIDVHVLPNGAMTYIPVVPDTAAGTMVDLSELEARRAAPAVGHAQPLHAAQVQHIDLFKAGRNVVEEGNVKTRGQRDKIIIRDGAAIPVDVQHFNLFSTDAKVQEDVDKPRCLRPMHCIWAEGQGPRRTDHKTPVRRRRATHQLGRWMRAEDEAQLMQRYQAKLRNKQRVPVAVLNATPHVKPVSDRTRPRTARRPWGTSGQRPSERDADATAARLEAARAARPKSARVHGAGAGLNAAAALGAAEESALSPARPFTARPKKPADVTGPIAARVERIPAPPPAPAAASRGRHNTRMKAQIASLHRKFFGDGGEPSGVCKA
eukprot:TRINITY_DN20246_c0_g1_i1.p1 TRINITY_DN20246_c0_g1~~TRINITY_DN20246_c0_g1_i1.p1  ORF type:complete len:403 (+),score=94.13 TRINITY_DN20246_c0_g1_i1:176-1210(+)